MKQPFRTYADMHLHSLASQHAYSTLAELCDAAKEKGGSPPSPPRHAPGYVSSSVSAGSASPSFTCPPCPKASIHSPYWIVKVWVPSA